MLSEERIKQLVKENKAYLDALKEFDRTGVLKKVRMKGRYNFTVDEMLMVNFRKVCSEEGVPMSRRVEQLIKGFLGSRGLP